MQVPVYDLTGAVVEQIEVSDRVFGAPFNEAVVHQVMVGQLANARQGTASTKTRGEVAGSSKKLYRQKHTGYSRAGSRRSPLRYKGGVIFGPHPRSYRQATPQKMRQQALRCVLSAKAADSELKVIKELNFGEPKTKKMVEVLSALGVKSTALVVTPDHNDNLLKSARNVPGIKTVRANLLNIVDLLSHKLLLMTVPAVRQTEALWGEKAAGENQHEPV